MLVVAGAAVAGGMVWAGAAAHPVPTPTPTVSPTLIFPRTVSWNQLTTGDCISVYSNAWEQNYRLVTCTDVHNAQVIASAALPVTEAYPGEKSLSATTAPLCAKQDLINRDALSAGFQIIVQRNFPASESVWSEHPFYQCFAVATDNRQLTKSLVPEH